MPHTLEKFNRVAMKGDSAHWREKMINARASKDADAYRLAKKRYSLTEEGIEELEEMQESETAEKCISTRNRIIAKFNEKYGYDMPAVGTRAERLKKKAARNKIKPEWSRSGINRDTGTRYNSRGWSKDRINEFTGTKYDMFGYDAGGRDKDRFHWYTDRDPLGYDREGYDERNRNRGGYHRETGLNKWGLDSTGHNAQGFNQQ